MPAQDADQLLKQAYELYKAAEFQQALDLLTREGPRFPDRGRTLYFWRLCMAARAGDPRLAVDILQAALDEGHWFNIAMLRGDTDLKSLQGLPEFERLVEASRERQAKAQVGVKPLLVTLEPDDLDESGATRYPLLLALHGNLQNAESTIPHWRPALEEGWIVAVPQSSQVGAPDEYIWNDRDCAARELLEHMAEIARDYPVDLERVVLAGFSMGAETAIWLALSRTIRARGFIAVGPGGPFMSEQEQWAPLLTAAGELDQRGYLVIGGEDAVCYDQTLDFAKLLGKYGLAYRLEGFPGLAHAFPADFPAVLRRALTFIAG